MNAPSVPLVDPDKPLAMTSKHFQTNKFAIYAHLREHLPVHRASILGVKLNIVARYDDCLTAVKDPRFLRNRATVTGGSKLPFPVPKSLKLLADSMIIEDDPEHRRLRTLVQKAFAPKNLRGLEESVEAYAHELLDGLDGQKAVDLQQAYALPIPVNVITRMMGANPEEMDALRSSIRVLSDGMSGWNVIRTFAWDLRKAVNFCRALIERKRKEPADDILTGLIEAEEAGDRLTEDEMVSMVFLLIIAGFETTVHLISNGTLALLEHPEELARLYEAPELMGSAVEEMLRYAGPIHGTKMNYASEDIELSGVTIAKGQPVMPLLASANRDPRVFDDPERFNITRDPNKHLSFSQGNHFCLGAFLARMETRVAFKVLLERCPNLRLAVDPSELEIQKTPGWHRHTRMPVHLS